MVIESRLPTAVARIYPAPAHFPVCATAGEATPAPTALRNSRRPAEVLVFISALSCWQADGCSASCWGMLLRRPLAGNRFGQVNAGYRGIHNSGNCHIGHTNHSFAVSSISRRFPCRVSTNVYSRSRIGALTASVKRPRRSSIFSSLCHRNSRQGRPSAREALREPRMAAGMRLTAGSPTSAFGRRVRPIKEFSRLRCSEQ